MNYKYPHAKVYRIDIEGETYVGSTKLQYLSMRKQSHKRGLKFDKHMKIYKFMRERDIDFSNINLELIVNFPCNTIEELRREEAKYIRDLKASLNRDIAGRSMAEYYEQNKHIILAYHKDYYHNNKSYIQDRQKEYYDSNKVTIVEKRKQYYAAKKAEINYRKSETVRCSICTTEVKKYNLPLHQLTKKCMNHK